MKASDGWNHLGSSTPPPLKRLNSPWCSTSMQSASIERLKELLDDVVMKHDGVPSSHGAALSHVDLPVSRHVPGRAAALWLISFGCFL